jgi:hypothetical protein
VRGRIVAPLISLTLLVLLISNCGGGGGSSAPPASTPETLAITTNTNVQCVMTVPFTLTLAVTGASTSVTWSILAGALPTGLTLNPTSGTISGTPTGGLGFSATIQAADSKASTSAQFSFNIWSKLTINPVTPAAAHINVPYSLPITANAPVASVSLSSGNLPPGLSLGMNPQSATGLILGTPTQTGSFVFTVQVQDSTIPQTATAQFTIVVDSHLTITKASLKTGGQNLAYSDSFTAVNGTTPYHWTFAGTLPPGLSMDPITGQVTGVPTAYANNVYSVSVSDSSTPVQTDTGQGILNIASQLQIIGTYQPAYVGQSYFQSISAVGGSFPYTWTISSGSLPPGLSFGGGQIFGTPTQLGTYNFVVQVKDSTSPPYVVTAPVVFSVTPVPLSVLGSPASPAPVNVIYHSQIPATGGTPPYSWSISSGQLPPGLVLDSATGDLDGTPTQTGTYNFVVMGTDGASPPQTATANDFIQIATHRGRNDSIATATPLGNSANVNVPVIYSISPYIDPMDAAVANPDTDFYRLVATGGSVVHVETSAQRAFTDGILNTVIELLDAGGNRLHTCVAPSYSSDCLNDDLNSTTTDSALDFKTPGASTTQTTIYAHVFDWRGDARPDMQYYLTVSGVIEPLKISPATLGVGATRGVSYQQQFTTTGGAGNVTWAISAGAQPTGWSLSSSGMLSGVATTDGVYTFTVRATDSANPPQTATTQYTLQIAEPVAITTSPNFPNACVGQPYSFTAKTTGGVPPIQFSFISPAWTSISLDQTTGTWSGTPTVAGTFQGSFGAVDSAQPPSVQGQAVTLIVLNPPCN